MPRLISALRNHLHFIVIVSILTAAMTWPTIRYVFDTSMFWLPIDSGDALMKLWDAWYLKSLIAGPGPTSTSPIYYSIPMAYRWSIIISTFRT